MSKQGLEIVSELAQLFAAGDFTAAFELYDPEIRVVQPESLPHGGLHRGRDGVRAMGAVFAKHWTRTISEPTRSACADGRVLQTTTQTFTSIATGRSATMDVVEIFSFKGNQVAEIRVFQHDTARLMETLSSARSQ